MGAADREGLWTLICDRAAFYYTMTGIVTELKRQIALKRGILKSKIKERREQKRGIKYDVGRSILRKAMIHKRERKKRRIKYAEVRKECKRAKRQISSLKAMVAADIKKIESVKEDLNEKLCRYKLPGDSIVDVHRLEDILGIAFYEMWAEERGLKVPFLVGPYQNLNKENALEKYADGFDMYVIRSWHR